MLESHGDRRFRGPRGTRRSPFRCLSAGRRLLLALAALSLAVPLTSASAQGVRFGRNRIALTASPGRLPADGQTLSRLRVEVRGQDNRPVPDGTEVIIATDIGDLTDQSGAKQTTVTLRTEGGYALVNLTSKEPGSATVRATYLDSRNQVLVEFLPLGEKGAAASTVVHVKGGWVGYSTDLSLIEARGPAELRYRGLTLDADALQVDPQSLVVKADGVKLKRRDAQLEGEDIYLELNSMKGVLRRFGDQGVEEVPLNGFTLQPGQAPEQLPTNAFRFDDREGHIWTVAKSLALFPGEKLVLRNASLHVDQHRLLRYPPYWVIAFEGYQGASNTNFATFDSRGGLAVDFPLFFSVTDTSTGAIKIQRGATNGAVMARQGWSFALMHTYEQPGQEAQGSITLSGLPRRDWGLQFLDTRKVLGGADSALSLASPDHRSLFTDYSVFSYGRAGSLSVHTHCDRPPGTESLAYGLNGDFLSNGLPVGRAAAFRWGTGIQAERDPFLRGGLVFEHHVSTYLDLNGWQPTGSISLVPSASDTFSWDTNGNASNVARTQLMLNQRIARGIGLNLRYGVEYRSGRDRFTTLDTQQGFNQQVSLNLTAYASKRWDAFVNASYNLTDGSLYGLGAVDYRPWRRWRLGVVGTYYRFSGLGFNDIEVSLNREVVGREVGVRWSTADRRFSLQLDAGTF